MTLRARLLLAALVITVTFVAALTYVSVRQRDVLTDQLDSQIEVVAENIGRGRDRFSALNNETLPRSEGFLATGELYFAVIDEGEHQVIARPVSEPDLVPDLAGVDLEQKAVDAQPFTVDASGSDAPARVVVVDIGQRSAVVAVSTGAVDDAQDQLLLTAAVALAIVLGAMAVVLWSVDRLGIKPIDSVTRAAEDIAAGRSDHRVEQQSSATEAGRLGIAFNTMLDARQAVEARQRRFVADASHELRTPLTTLRGYAALHASGDLNAAETDDAMARIHSESKRMEALVEDLLRLASLDEGRPLDYSSIDLSQLMHDLAADAAAIQPERLIDSSNINPDLMLQADGHQLTQALTTVVNNALRHTPATAKLTLAATMNEATVRIQIADQGPGIAPDHLTNLFERFYRADPGRQRSAGGSGLGLSIAHAIVTAHHGHIGATSTLGQGTTITIDLPIAKPPTTKQEDQS